ncbi:hypothetical protein AB2M62_13530 [Sphingomonas sp. MMS12-HWE2-04]|uniref:hypothetical protein n=1 Tax=Sphingomonas sp. MMS12-HWE2-04 TaxID=3234199 RepID=UPI0038505A74
MTIDDLYAQHRELMRLCEDILTAASTSPPAMADLLAARRAMAQAMARHLADETVLALKPLGTSPDAGDRALARRYTDDLLVLRQGSTAHYAAWTAETIAAAPREYRLQVRQLMNVMAARRLWEETEFLPAASRLLANPLRKAG